jgi:hypothetical protein
MRLQTTLLAGIAGTVVAASVANAGVSLQILTVTASTPDGTVIGSHTYSRPNVPLDPSGMHSWDLPAVPELTFADAGSVDGTWGFKGGSIVVNEDPAVTLNFNASSGAVNSVFTFSSAIVNFPTAGNLQAVASAAITITDSGLFPDGNVSLTGGFAGGTKAYRAEIDGAFTYASLVNNFAGPLSGSTVLSGSTGVLSPVIGHTTASQIRTYFSFTLSARDKAAGTSTFQIIPAPGAASLLAAGGMLTLRRRRR